MVAYAKNQEQELRRVFLDGRLPLDNRRSERALRKVVVGRKNWMFYGSDVHAEAAAAIFSLVASCRLHQLDPELYLDEVMRVLPYWPRERYIELAPNRWRATRAALGPKELELPIGPITVPAMLAATAAYPGLAVDVGSVQRLPHMWLDAHRGAVPAAANVPLIEIRRPSCVSRERVGCCLRADTGAELVAKDDSQLDAREGFDVET